jgi:hypothetical protein
LSRRSPVDAPSNCMGPRAVDKSTLLRFLAHHLPVGHACGGVAHLSARGLSHVLVRASSAAVPVTAVAVLVQLVAASTSSTARSSRQLSGGVPRGAVVVGLAGRRGQREQVDQVGPLERLHPGLLQLAVAAQPRPVAVASPPTNERQASAPLEIARRGGSGKRQGVVYVHRNGCLGEYDPSRLTPQQTAVCASPVCRSRLMWLCLASSSWQECGLGKLEMRGSARLRWTSIGRFHRASCGRIVL